MPLLKQTEIELVEQNQRMNDYPPQWARMANILERRVESRIFYRGEDRFFGLMNNQIVSSLIVLLLVITAIYGIFNKDKE